MSRAGWKKPWIKLLTLQGVWHQLDSYSCLSNPVTHPVTLLITDVWGCSENQFIGCLFFKPFCQLFFLWFAMFCKLGHCASSFGGIGDWVAPLCHGDGPGLMPQEVSSLISLWPKPLCQAPALWRLEAPHKQSKGTKAVFIHLLQLCLCWFLQVSVRECKETKPSVIDGLDSNELSAPYDHTLNPLCYAPEKLYDLFALFFPLFQKPKLLLFI